MTFLPAPAFFVEAPVLYGLGDVVGENLFAVCQVRNRA